MSETWQVCNKQKSPNIHQQKILTLLLNPNDNLTLPLDFITLNLKITV